MKSFFLILILAIGFNLAQAQKSEISSQSELAVATSSSNTSTHIHGDDSSKAPGKADIMTARPFFIPTANYPNVDAYVADNIQFPEEARIAGRYGIVKVQFDISSEGEIENIHFLKCPDPVFEEETLRLLHAMPNWQSAMSGVTPIKSKSQLNLNFSLR